MKLRKEILIISLILGMFCLAVPASAAYSNSQLFTITSSSEADISDYQLVLTLSNATGTSSGTTIYTNGITQSDWRDIRFTFLEDGVDTGTNCPYWLDTASQTSNTIIVYVRVPAIYADDTAGIKISYGDAGVSSASSGVDTFPLFDDFNAKNTTTWYFNSGTVSSGKLNLSAANTKASAESKQHFSSADGWIITTRVSTAHNTSSTYMQENPVGFRSNSTGYGNYFFTMHTYNNNYLYNNNSAGAYGTTCSTKWLSNTQTLLELARTSSFSSVAYNSGTKTSSSYLTDADDFAVYISAQSVSSSYTATVLTDWVAVRKYTSSDLELVSVIAADFPTANFSANTTIGGLPLTVLFTDSSYSNITSWQWDFGDGNTSTEQNPTHTYYIEGSYSVVLTAANSTGNDTVTKANYIYLSASPIADFTSSETYGVSPLTVHFTDLSVNGPTSWYWDFGDGNTSTEQNPTHTYYNNNSTNYTVSLSIEGVGGGDSEIKTAYIKITPESTGHAAHLSNVTDTWAYIAVNDSYEVRFNANQSAAIVHWQVNGGNITNTTVMSYAQTYTEPGYYNVTGWIENENGLSENAVEYHIRVGRAKATTHISNISNTYPELEANITNMSTDGILVNLVTPFTNIIGKPFYLILFCLPFLFIWMQTGRLTIVTTLSLILGVLFIGFIPSEFQAFIGLAIAASFASAFYKLSRGP